MQNFFNNFTEDRRKGYRSKIMSCGNPDLGFGTTLAIFMASGNIPVKKDRLIKLN